MRFFAILFLVAPLFADSPLDFKKIAKEATPAVVSVKVEMKREAPFGRMEPFGDDFWQRFFQLPKENYRPQMGQGSGFLVSSDGMILTNNHIVDNAERVLVTLQNGREYTATILGKDQNSDVAVIKIDAKELPFLKLGDSRKLEVGEWVVAIGNPLGLQATLTVGVVSAVDRSNLGLAQIEDFIQTDAAINRGNSGGPLLNLEGEVVGMNTAIASHTGGYMGIGFAIPSNIAKEIMQQLVSNGSFTRGYIGIVMQPLDQNLADAFHLDEMSGALVAEVATDSPAEKAGIKRGDVITKLNGKKIASISLLRNSIAMMKPGDHLNLTVFREGKEIDLELIINAFPTKSIADKGQSNSLGLTVATSKEEEKGVVVIGVDPDSIAALAGIRKGALILAVNQKEIKTAEEFFLAVSETPKENPVLLLVKQGAVTQFISLRSR